MHLGAGERTQDKIRRVQLEGSRYADRPPIGNPDIIEHAQREQLMRFYHDWYRPDLMAVIVVGDVDRDAVAAMIKAALLVARRARRRSGRGPTFDVPEHPGTRYAVVTDKETTATAVADQRPPAGAQPGIGRRLSRASCSTSCSPTCSAPGSTSSARARIRRSSGRPPDRALFPAPRTRDEAMLQALVSNDGVTRGLDALVTELQRVARFGFTATELARAKQAMMLGYERVVTESPDRESESRADEYTRNFLQDEALPTIWQELAFHRRFLPGITLAEVNALAGDWFPDREPARRRLGAGGGRRRPARPRRSSRRS